MASYIILILFGSLLCYIMYSEKRKHRKFGGNSISVQGVVVDYETGGEKNQATKFPVVRFTTQNGDTVIKKSTEGFFSTRIKKGMKITVIYNREEPADFLLIQPKFQSLYITVIIGGMLFVLSGLILALNEAGIVHLFKK